MRREVADKIIAIVKQHDEVLNDLTILTEDIDDEAERKEVRRALAELCFDMHEKITLEIVKQYPDLHPDKEG
jgi:hypothetical protein